MTKRKSTKRALLLSALSLLMCVSMLVGSTFAWFTDSVTSANNIIKSGNLDVELYYQAEGQSSWTEVDENTNIFMENALWEPGHTEVVKLKVVNEGTLALKYQLGVNIASETGSKNVNGEAFKLSDFIKYAVIEGEQDYDREAAVAAAEANNATLLKTSYATDSISLLPNTDNEDIVTMVVYMPTTVGNEANYAKGEAVPTINLGINLFATQYTAESDSFGSDYDKNATYPAVRTEVAEGGDTITAGEVAIELPTDAEEAEYTVNVDNKVVATDADGDTTVSFDIELLKDGVKVEPQAGVTYPVSIYIGKNLNVTEVTHKGAAVANWSYDSAEGVVSFETDSFSPFAVSYFSGMVETAADIEALIAKGADLIVLGNDITFTTGANGTTNGISYTAGKNFTLDLNGKTITSNLGNNALRFKIGDGNDVKNTNVEITIKNGKIVSGANNWCAISAATADNSGNKLTLNLEDLEVVASKAGDYAVKAWTGAVIKAKNVTTTTTYAGGFYAVGGEIVLDNCTAVQTGLHTAPYMSMAFAVSTNGKMTVNSGTYTATPAAASDAYNQGTSHGSWVGGIMNSGGTLIINGGTFTNGNFGEDSAATNARGLIMADTGAVIEINGGTFTAMKAILDMTNNLGDASRNPSATLSGGTYSADPRVSGLYASHLIKLADGYEAFDNGNGTWTVEIPKVANATDFKNAVADGGKIQIDGKIAVEDLAFAFGGESTVIGGTLSRDTASGNPLTVNTTETVTFEGVKFESVKGSAVLATRKEGANIVLNNCSVENFGAPSTGNTGIQVYAKNVTMTFNGCTFKNMPIVTSSSYAGPVKLVFNDCTFSWVGASCPGMIKLENNIQADVDFNNCKFTYNAEDSKSAKDFVNTRTSVAAGTTIDFNNFEMIGTGSVCKAWSIVTKGGVITGENVVVTATGTNVYTFNGEQVDFGAYLFK